MGRVPAHGEGGRTALRAPEHARAALIAACSLPRASRCTRALAPPRRRYNIRVKGEGEAGGAGERQGAGAGQSQGVLVGS